jgi:hypothetical protein
MFVPGFELLAVVEFQLHVRWEEDLCHVLNLALPREVAR